MMRSLYSGVGGLKNHQTRMDVIGNNIANVNTTGYKAGRVTFQDTLSQTMSAASAPSNTLGGTNPQQVGLGSALSSIDTIFTNGSVQSTGKNTDLCISGSGLFVVKSGQGTFYTRNGAFDFDQQGNYILPGSGLYVQGWTATNGVLNTNAEPGNITIQAGKSMAAAQSSVSNYYNNLSASTKGSAITNIQVTYADGTTETVSNYAPVVSNDPNAKILLTLSDGRTIEADPAGGPYNVTGPTDPSPVGYYTGTLYNSNITAISPTTGTLKLALANSSASDPGVFVPTNIDVTSGTYKIGDTYSSAEIISSITTDPVAKTITLNFTNTGHKFNSVTIPQPATGTYAVGDTFTVQKKITGATTDGSNDFNFTLANGQTIPANTSTTYNLGGNYTESTTGSGIKITSVTRMEGNYSFNGKPVKSVGVVLADGTTTNALNGANYASNSTFYPSTSTTITTYDSLGNAHSVPVLITKTAENTWGLSLPGGGNNYTINEDDGSTTTVNLTATNLKFDTSGKYVSGTASLAMTYTNGAANNNVTINLSGLTQYAGNTTVTADTDGNAAGVLSNISVDSSGVITGTYTNGVTQAEAQVAMAQFNNPAGLLKSGSSLYSVSNNSGNANVKTANALGVKITPSALEMSNVDLSSEFSDMIVTQRGFQSNSKIITVSDEMLETLVNMKR